jgi:hypothetical protein
VARLAAAAVSSSVVSRAGIPALEDRDLLLGLRDGLPDLLYHRIEVLGALPLEGAHALLMLGVGVDPLPPLGVAKELGVGPLELGLYRLAPAPQLH